MLWSGRNLLRVLEIYVPVKSIVGSGCRPKQSLSSASLTVNACFHCTIARLLDDAVVVIDKRSTVSVGQRKGSQNMILAKGT